MRGSGRPQPHAPAQELLPDRRHRAAPLFLTVYIIWTFVSWVDNRIKPLIPARYSPETYLPFPVPGFGLVVALVFMTLLGFLTANLVGRRLVALGEIAPRPDADRAQPLSRPQADLRDGALATGSTFRNVGLVEFPRDGHVVAGLPVERRQGRGRTSRLARTASDDRHRLRADTPNPTTGFFFFVKRSDVIDPRHVASRRRPRWSSRPGWSRRSIGDRERRAVPAATAERRVAHDRGQPALISRIASSRPKR